MADHSTHAHTTKPLADGATRTSYEPPVSQDAASRTFVVSLDAKDGYAVITDFRAGDRIQLDCDELGDYQLIPGNHHGADNGGFCIFYVGEHRSSDAGDLIAEVSGPAAGSLDLMDASTFVWKIPEGVAIAVGLPSNDIVIGTDANDVLSGCMGSDVVIGGAGDDVISGVHTEMPLPGRDEIDVLIGGLGQDRFVLSGHHGIYYKDVVGQSSISYAAIQDFERGDRIVLEREKIGSYELVATTVGLSAATSIYYNRDGKPGISVYDDLISVVQGPAARSLDLMDANTFQWGIDPEAIDAVGGSTNDILMGSDGDDVLIGRGGSDGLMGGLGDDTLIGVDPEAPLPGQGETDVLIGDPGADLFVLGSRLKDFYLDFGTAGGKGYAAIQDFDTGDAIALAGAKGDYALQTCTVGLADATCIYANRDGEAGVGSDDDLVAVVQGPGASGLSLDSDQFRWGYEAPAIVTAQTLEARPGQLVEQSRLPQSGAFTCRNDEGGFSADFPSSSESSDVVMLGVASGPGRSRVDRSQTVEDADGASESIDRAARDCLPGEIDNYIHTRGGNDTIIGSAGSDFIRAGAGDDLIDARAGDDVVRSGSGSDRVALGSGADQLLITRDQLAGRDLLLDFSNEDRLVLADGIQVLSGIGTNLLTVGVATGAHQELQLTGGSLGTWSEGLIRSLP
jgi:Ca2+-binding RTX toxin-like protein